MEHRRDILQRARLLPFALPGLVRTLVYAGTHQYPADERPGLVAANVTGYLAAISSVCYAINYALHDFENLAPIVYGNLISAIITALIPLAHRFGRVAGALVLVATVFTTIFYFIAVVGRDSGIQLNYIGAAALAFVVIGLQRIWLVGAIIVVAAVLHLTAWFMFQEGMVQFRDSQAFLDQIYTLSAISIMAIIALVVFYAFGLVRDAQDRSDALLLNIMPATIAERLKERPDSTIAERYENATILFADLTGFTPLTNRLGPAGIVDLLDELFTSFDELALRHNVEKIKTIGDAYMAVTGLPEERPDHAACMARMALDMRDAIRRISDRNGLALNIRVGIASGPVIAGVIGRTKFSYDVWGETVNLAARLEPKAHAGQILVGEMVVEAIRHQFDFEDRGPLELKGIGQVPAWTLIGEKCAKPRPAELERLQDSAI